MILAQLDQIDRRAVNSSLAPSQFSNVASKWPLYTLASSAIEYKKLTGTAHLPRNDQVVSITVYVCLYEWVRAHTHTLTLILF